MDDDASFGRWLAQRRHALHLSRAELARRISCATVTLRKIEEDARRSSPELAGKLAEHLHMSASERELFVLVARGERRVAWLPPPDQLGGISAPLNRHLHPADSSISSPLRTNLPALLTSFIGRTEALANVTDRITGRRLVTLTGAGGVGKTRLATEVGIHMMRYTHGFADGVWMVELAPLSQPTLVAQAIARLFNLQEQPGRPARELLRAYLADRQLLLILDNCEHLVDVCADIVENLLHHCWHLHILATSREELRIPGEAIYAVAPLAVPDLVAPASVQLLDAAAPQLFVERMDTHYPVRRISAEEAVTIASICRQLDGIPLALELAAPLTRTMALADIAAQLHDQMATLTSTYRTTIPRHQTMHRALLWSYQLLAPAEQKLLLRVAVFAGGWTGAAAQAVCAEHLEGDLAATLQQLVAKSLVLVEDQNGQRRYRLLEPVRQFAQTELAASDELPALRRRHATYFLALAEEMDRARDTPQEQTWLQKLTPERDNIRAVNTWALEHGEVEFAQRFNGWLFAFWIYCSSRTEAIHWLESALNLQRIESDASPTLSAISAEILALNAAGYAAVLHRDYYPQARAWFERELALCMRIDDQRGIATALRGCAFIAMLRHDLAESHRLGEQALALSRSIQDYAAVAWSLFALGYLAMVRGDFVSAQSLLQEALPQLRKYGITFGLFRALLALGHVMRARNDLDRARSSYHEALRLQQTMHYTQEVTDGLERLAGIAALAGAPIRAAQLFGAAEACREAVAMLRWQHLEEIYERDVTLARSQCDPAAWQAAWSAGYAMTLESAVAFALEE